MSIAFTAVPLRHSCPQVYTSQCLRHRSADRRQYRHQGGRSPLLRSEHLIPHFQTVDRCRPLRKSSRYHRPPRGYRFLQLHRSCQLRRLPRSCHFLTGRTSSRPRRPQESGRVLLHHKLYHLRHRHEANRHHPRHPEQHHP